ncbi:Fe2+-enterobactin ABC transporter substrate-binding protein [Vibrio cholerae]|nr:Fe2+-enterobactin ABC transporter substrate-binding protein [Vibrio cholerae]EGR0545848.1 Fe2+-enterobactin ABC transporter substrate-binding protein [Vibrio cholerae]EGR0547374.1 Fe2+-enterobactin ABC transporter substrate-binding protein [Vibrio cholerae]EGR0570572.1 Fe2+-enterobactin ABC transporter substrate-binding protein [Vibrio cholerae]EGR0573370.1 Fe2+-enterobactin ABC transporter substrate-binding protein [Vibrio cholerae]
MRINITMKNIFILLSMILGCLFSGLVSAQQNVWPRTFQNADGSITTIPSQPKRILSTAVTVTGTLLAIDAPVIASAATTQSTFFEQWRKLAELRQVKKLWPAGSVDLESVYVEQPDLIVVSMIGADSARDQIPLLQAIAPTILVDYSDQTWQSLAQQLGLATGLEDQAERTIHNFEQWTKQVRDVLDLPKGRANIVSYHGPGMVNAVAKAQSAHAQLLQSVGVALEEPDPAWQAGSIVHRDFLRIHYEHLTQLQAETTFLITMTDQQAQAFLHDPILKNLPSIQRKQVYGLGENSFRIDLFSAREIINSLLRRFAGEQAQSLVMP